MMQDEWLSMTPEQQARQMLRDIVVLHAKMEELIDEDDWHPAYLMAVTGGWLNYVFSQVFSDEDFYSFIDKLLNSHKARRGTPQ